MPGLEGIAAIVRKRVTLKILLPAASAILLLLGALGFLISSYVEEYVHSSATRLSRAEIDGSIRNLQSIYSVMSDRTAASMATLKILGKSQGEASSGKAIDFGGSNVPDLKFGSRSQVGDYSIVDQVKSLTGSTATLFVLRNSDFVRISTNVLKVDGSRAVGTVLDPGGKAYAAVNNGRSFLGVTEILGAPYFTSYEPIADAAGKTIGVWYVGFPISSLKEIEAAIARTKILESGFIALFDARGNVRFRSSSASPEIVKQVYKQQETENQDWVVLKKPVESWGYTVVAAYPTSDVNSQVATVRRYIAFLGAAFALMLVIVLSILLDRLILRPVKTFEAAANRAAKGDVDVSVLLTRKDELGSLSMSFDALIQDIKQKAAQLNAIAGGDLSIEVLKKSDSDRLSISMIEVVNNLRLLVAETGKLSQSAVEGQLSMRGDADLFKGVYGEIVDGINRTLESVTSPINEAANVLEGVALKDLSLRMRGSYSGDLARIKNSVNQAVQNLDDALLQVSLGAEQVASASRQISEGSQSLSQGASEQEISIQQVSKSLRDVSDITQQNAANAEAAQRLSDAARMSSDKGVASMQRMSKAIEQIKASSDATSKILKNIDDIAFQTNLLALNAAVEAARAGEAGKGFAVVAEEVRNLARRSAEAARNTADLIEEAMKNAGNGVNINNEVLENLIEINDQVRKVSEVMTEITAASETQRSGVTRVGTTVDHMSQMTQKVAANAVESASAAEEMSGQAEEMRSMIASFQLSKTGSAGTSNGFYPGKLKDANTYFASSQRPY